MVMLLGRLWRVVQWVGSPSAVGALALTIAVGGGGLRVTLGITLRAVAESLPIRTFAGLLFVSLVAAAIRGAGERRPGFALMAVGALALLSGGVQWTLWGYEGRLEAGQGEQAAKWVRVDAGRRSSQPPDVEPISVVPGDAVRVRVAGRVVELPPGSWVDTGVGLRLRLAARSWAPLVTVRSRADGQVVRQGFVKVAPAGESAAYFELGTLPHRFYLDPPAGWDGAAPTTLDARVTRGKLEVARGPLPMGGALGMDGLELTWSEGAPWVRLDGAGSLPWSLIGGAVLLAAIGTLLELRRLRA